MEFCIVIQARLGSKRFPAKILKTIYKNYNSLTFLINLVRKTDYELVVTTTKSSVDNKIVNICKKKNINYFRGSENNVYERYKQTAKKYNIDNIIRITSDCPLLDVFLLDKIKNEFISKKLDYISNTLPINESKFPNGSDIEIFKSKLFQKYKSLTKEDKEHVTNVFWQDKRIKKKIFKSNINYSNLRYTLDYNKDLIVIKKILKFLKKNKKKITYKNICKFLLNNPQIANLNKEANNIFQGNNIIK